MNSFVDRQLSEFEIRNALRVHLAASSCPGAVVREEMPIGKSRIDMACLGNLLEGFEIKSDFDSFVRLALQAASFGSVFDRVSLVTGGALAADACRQVPACWGLLVASRSTTHAGKETVTLREVRKPTVNPHQSSTALAAMLWKHELVEAHKALGTAAAKSSWNSNRLREELVVQAPLEWIKGRVVERLMDPLRAEPLERAAAQRSEARSRRPYGALTVTRPPRVYSMPLGIP